MSTPKNPELSPPSQLLPSDCLVVLGLWSASLQTLTPRDGPMSSMLQLFYLEKENTSSRCECKNPKDVYRKSSPAQFWLLYMIFSSLSLHHVTFTWLARGLFATLEVLNNLWTFLLSSSAFSFCLATAFLGLFPFNHPWCYHFLIQKCMFSMHFRLVKNNLAAAN